MVSDTRGHEIPAGSDPWGYREDMEQFSKSIADVRPVADGDEARAMIADLQAQDIDPTGQLFWITNPGAMYYYNGGITSSGLTPLAEKSQLSGVAAEMANGTVSFSSTKPGTTKTKAVTFPSNRFAGSPNVVVNPRTSDPKTRSVSAQEISASGFTAIFQHTGSTASAVNVDYIAMRWGSSAANQATLMSALAPMEAVTCPTSWCTNRDVEIPIRTTWTDDEGNSHPIDEYECGVCGADITDTLHPIEGS